MSSTSVEIKAYLTGRWLTDLANFSAFVFHQMPHLNWAGFYLDQGQRLELGPFVGKPACTEIACGRGVCGTAFRERRALLVPDVHEFPGHIACDSASRAEMVLPFFLGGHCVGVFDLDSPLPDRFTEVDRALVQEWLATLAQQLPAELGARPPWHQ
jgi:L-methionine (R)-S-oxide reductase